MLNPIRVDAIVDLAYGALIVLAILLIATFEFGIGIAFGLGVFSAYVVHVIWKMARFDPDWMTQAVEQTVEKQVGETVEKQVGETVEKQVGETVEKQVGEVEAQVEEVVGEAVEETVGETVEEQVKQVKEQVQAVDDRVERRPRTDEIEEIVEDSIENELDQ